MRLLPPLEYDGSGWHSAFQSALLKNSTQAHLLRSHDPDSQDNLQTCCEHFHLGTIYFLPYTVSASTRGCKARAQDSRRCRRLCRPP